MAIPALDEPGTSASSSSHTPDNVNKECSSKMDISLYKDKWLSGTEKLHILENLWAPSSNYKFPATTNGKQERKFLYSWLEKYKWLSYSEIENQAYCTFCVLMAPTEVGMRSSQKTGQLVQEGFQNWKKAIEKFESHSHLQYHKHAMVDLNNLKTLVEGKKMNSIDRSLDVGKAKQAKENAERLKPIIETVIFCGRQGIALRGHRDYGDFDLDAMPDDNEGNFRALLRMRIEAGDEKLRNHFKSCGKNATYISWNIQNQIIDACDKVIKSRIVKDVKDATFFSVLADETTDVSTQEQFSLSVRYVSHNTKDGYKINEKFLQFVPLESTTGEVLGETLLKGLEECNLEIKDLRGQGYDGASAMSGKVKGAQAVVQKRCPKAVYVHCASHSLNLAITNAAEVRSIRNCFGTTEKVWSFFNTPKRQNVLQRKIETLAPKTKNQKLKQLCPTRWVQRHDAVLVMKELYNPIISSLEEIKCWDDKDTSSGADVLLTAICQSEYIVALVSAEKLLSYTLILCQKLQSSDADLWAALNYAHYVLQSLKSLREKVDDEFSVLFQEAQKMAELNETTISVPRIVGRQTHRSNISAESIEQFYRINVFIPWIESFISCIEERLLKHQNILKGFHCLLHTYPENSEESKEMKEAFLKLIEVYEEDLEINNSKVLMAEMEVWQAFLQRNKAHHVNAIDFLNICDKTIFPNIHILLKIFITIPVSTSTAERSFSTLRRIKTYLRNTMSESRLNGLANLNIHREIPVETDSVLAILMKTQRRLNFVL